MDGVASVGRVGAVPRILEANSPREPRGAQDEPNVADGVASAALHLIRAALVLEPLVGSDLDVRV